MAAHLHAACARVPDCVESHHWFWGIPEFFKNPYRRQIELVSHDSWTVRIRSPSSRRLEREPQNSFQNTQVEGILNRLGFHTGPRRAEGGPRWTPRDQGQEPRGRPGPQGRDRPARVPRRGRGPRRRGDPPPGRPGDPRESRAPVWNLNRFKIPST